MSRPRSLARPLTWLLAAALAAPLALGCAGVSPEVARARAAVYGGERARLVDEIAAVVQPRYGVQQVDPAAGRVVSEPRWFDKDGSAESRKADDSAAMLSDGSIQLAFTVTVEGNEGAWQVRVAPVLARYLLGSPQLQPLGADDPEVPGWVVGKREALEVELHGRLAPLATPASPTAAPAP